MGGLHIIEDHVVSGLILQMLANYGEAASG
jgi:hypothetical protein